MAYVVVKPLARAELVDMDVDLDMDMAERGTDFAVDALDKDALGADAPDMVGSALE